MLKKKISKYTKIFLNIDSGDFNHVKTVRFQSKSLNEWSYIDEQPCKVILAFKFTKELM